MNPDEADALTGQASKQHLRAGTPAARSTGASVKLDAAMQPVGAGWRVPEWRRT